MSDASLLLDEAAVEGRPFDLIWVRFGFLIQF